jgi:NHLM bacteriocin system ABC transporter peptidase/ATP-binding protein
MISFLPRRRARVPTILQQEAVECGAACLAMILAGHGRWTSLEELRESCGVGRDGTKAVNLLRVARGFGMIAKGLKKEVADLAHLACPFIVFWNFNHFVVVEQIRLRGDNRGFVWINDPASGPRAVAGSEFNQSYTGVVLAFEPGVEFVEQGARPSLASLLKARLAGYGFSLGHALLAGALLLIPSIVAAGFSRIFIDHVVLDKAQSWLWPLIGAMAGFALLRALLSFLQQSTLARMQTAIGTSAAAQQMWSVLHLSLGFFAQRYAADIANRFTMADRLSGMVAGGLAPTGIACISIIGYGLALFVLDPVMAAIAACSAGLALLLLGLSSRGLDDVNRRMVTDESRFQAATVNGVHSADDFRATGTEGLFMARWMGYQAKVVDAEQASRFRSSLLSQLSSLIMALGVVAVMVVGGIRVIDGLITIGILLAFQTLMGSFAGSVLSLVGGGGQLQQVRGLAERLDDIACYKTVLQASPLPPPKLLLAPGAGIGLEMRRVTFGYAPLEPPFIEEFCLKLAPGSRVALVGGSGSGKSTIGRLIVGLMEPCGGDILLGGVPLGEWPTARLRKQIAFVDQEVGLFEGSIRDNITLWDASMPEQRIVAAARDAGAHDFITARPGGYDARLAESGGNLSGGERQRLALARALAVQPSILVLDEATSALDPPVEKAVMNAIRRRGCACVIIAHRLSTIRDCDVIVVLDKGRIVEVGNHATLAAGGDRYRALIEN